MRVWLFFCLFHPAADVTLQSYQASVDINLVEVEPIVSEILTSQLASPVMTKEKSGRAGEPKD